MEQTEQFETWALIEIMGHTKVAGMARTKTFGSTVMLQVDIPETTTQPAFTKMYSMSSIFSITPVTEELAIMHAEAYKVHAVTEYSVQMALLKKVNKEVEEKVEERLREIKALASVEDGFNTYKNEIQENLSNRGYIIAFEDDEIKPYYLQQASSEYVADFLIFKNNKTDFSE